MAMMCKAPGRAFTWLTTLLMASLLPVSVAASGGSASPAYDPRLADQFQTAKNGDTVPGEPSARETWAKHLAYDATIYGTVAVLQYRQMYDQAVDKSSGSYIGFNRFAHGRALAGPGYAPFKTPNADILYSNAYLDLRDGPVLFDVPDTGGRYFTANFLDMFGNATNIGARIQGTRGGRYLIATTDWHDRARRRDIVQGGNALHVDTASRVCLQSGRFTLGQRAAGTVRPFRHVSPAIGNPIP